jgi:dTDP-4-amino-4,6-dideoxygalactose transaminase
MSHDPDGPWYYQQVALGYNYRMTELQSVLGLSQLERMDDYVRTRHRLSERYARLLADLPVVLPWQLPGTYSGLHLYVIRLKLPELAVSHLQVFNSLREQGIGVNLHYIPVHTQPYYQAMGFRPGDFPEAENYYREAISLPMYSSLSDAQQDEVVAALRKSLLT